MFRLRNIAKISKYYSSLKFIFFCTLLYLIFIASSSKKIIRIPSFSKPVKTLPRMDDSYQVKFLDFHMKLKPNWRFIANDLNFIIHMQKQKKPIQQFKINFETMNSLAFGTLSGIRMSQKLRQDQLQSFFLNRLKKKLMIKKILWSKKYKINNNNYVAFISKSILKKQQNNKSFHTELYFALYFSKNYIYEIIITSSINKNYNFNEDALSIIKNFFINTQSINKLRIINKGVKISYLDDWDLINLKEKQILNFRHLKYPFFFDLQFLNLTTNKQTYQQLIDLNLYQFFNFISLATYDYNFVKKLSKKNIFKISKFNSKYPGILIYIFGLDRSIKLKLQTRIQLYYFVVNNRVYLLRLWYNEYNVDYDKTIKSILNQLKFL